MENDRVWSLAANEEIRIDSWCLLPHENDISGCPIISQDTLSSVLLFLKYLVMCIQRKYILELLIRFQESPFCLFVKLNPSFGREL